MADNIIRGRDVGGVPSDTRFASRQRPAAETSLRPAPQTFTEVLRASEANHSVFVDDFTPEGHFQATVKVLGVVTTYTFAGEQGDTSAPIVEREEIHGEYPNMRVLRYVGGGLKGGALSPERERFSRRVNLDEVPVAELRERYTAAAAAVESARDATFAAPQNRGFAFAHEASVAHLSRLRTALETADPDWGEFLD